MAKRPLRARAPVVVAPAMVSQLNSEPTIGIDPRRFLDHLVPLCKGDVTKLGKLRLVPLDVAVEALRRLAETGEGDDAESGEPTERQPETADAVLAALGMERT
ncbi:MAG TPA: hypothetical protein VK841_18930 [Polyangiaceae bacterium]|nr:hypothetical protein [Polyangiaceae bacterium]